MRFRADTRLPSPSTVDFSLQDQVESRAAQKFPSTGEIRPLKFLKKQLEVGNPQLPVISAWKF